MFGEDWFIQQRHKPIGKVSRMNEYDRLSGSSNFVFELNALECCAIQAALFHDLGP